MPSEPPLPPAASTRSIDPEVSVQRCELGFGLFARRSFVVDEEILVFTGPELSFEAMVARGEVEANALQIDDSLYLDIGAPGVFANHSCLPNAGIRHDRRLVALRPIQAGEEIRYDYSTTMWENHWTMACRCGHDNCRRLIADFHTLPTHVQQHYLHLQVVQTFIVRRLQGLLRRR